VALARAGAPALPRPEWLVAGSPLGVFWDWAQGIAAQDAGLLRTVAGRLEAMACPYESALALRDANDLTAAYRRLRALGATSAREQVARLLRAADQPIPRGPRSGTDAPALTDTERAVCRLVTGGATNESAANELRIGVRTVEAHLSRIYQKTGQRGRTLLARWWAERERDGDGAWSGRCAGHTRQHLGGEQLQRAHQPGVRHQAVVLPGE
jgi:DNA-binding CsgD family transcriptional regulator